MSYTDDQYQGLKYERDRLKANLLESDASVVQKDNELMVMRGDRDRWKAKAEKLAETLDDLICGRIDDEMASKILVSYVKDVGK